MQFTNSSIPKLFFQPPVSLGKRKSDLISKPSFFFYLMKVNGAQWFCLWGSGALQIQFLSQLLPISHSVWCPVPLWELK